MPSQRSLIAIPLLAALLLTVSACGTPGGTLQTYPNAGDLIVEPKATPTDAIVTSDAAADAWDIYLEGYGQRGWQAVGRLCIWAKERGMKDAPC